MGGSAHTPKILWLVVGVSVALSGSMVRAQTAERTYDSENFRFTWTDDARSPEAPDLADDDGDGLPDSIARLADAFEAARTFLLDDLGYAAPPVEGRYRVYIVPGAIRVERAPGGTGRSDASFIVVNPGAVHQDTSDTRMRAFAVHEYFHAIQLGYDGDEKHWIKEASSTWVEDEFQDAVDSNHSALLGFLPYPRLGLEAPVADHEYGAFIFLQFLVERYGPMPDPRSIIRELWNEMAVVESPVGGPDEDALGAISAVLARHGATLEEGWREFTLWQRRLGLFDEGASYRTVVDPSPWPTYLSDAAVKGESCRRTTDLSQFDKLPPLSSDYASFEPARRVAGSALLSVEGPAGATAFALIKRPSEPAETVSLSFSDSGVAQTTIPFARRQTKRIVVGLGNASSADATIFYSLRTLGSDDTELSGPTGGPTGRFDPIFGTATPFSGFVSCAGLGQPASPIEIVERENVSGITRTFTIRSQADGRWFSLFSPSVNSTYSARLVDPLLGPGEAQQWLLAVHVAMTIEVADDSVSLGEPLHVSGSLIPAHPDAVVAIDFRRPDGLRQIAVEVEPNADGSYSADIVLPRDGIWLVRARMTTTGDSDHEPGVSTERVVEVRAEG